MVKESKDTRQVLLDTAICLITQNSYGSVSVDDICTEADVKKGSFYYFFPSKHDLAQAAFLAHWNEATKILDHIFSPALHPLQRIEQYCATKYQLQKESYELYGKVCGCAFATLAAEMGAQDENFRLLTLEVFNKYNLYFENTLRDMAELQIISRQDIKEKATEINAYSLGVLLSAKIHNNVEIIQRDLKPGIFRILGIKEALRPTQEYQPSHVHLTEWSTGKMRENDPNNQ